MWRTRQKKTYLSRKITISPLRIFAKYLHVLCGLLFGGAQRLVDSFNNRHLFKSVVVLAGGTGVAQAIGILSYPIVTRLYLPEHLGLLNVFVAILGIATPLLTLRYAVTIPIAEDDDLADNVLRLCILVTILVTSLFTLGLVLLGPVIHERYPKYDAGSYLWLLPVCLVGTGLYQALSSWSVRAREFNLVAGTSLLQGTLSAATKISLGFMGIRPLGLLLGFVVSQVGGSTSMLRVLFRQRPGFVRRSSWRGVCFAARRFVHFPLWQTWAQFLLGLGAQLPTLFIAAWYGADAAGFYGLAFNMVNMPMTVVGQSVAQVYFSEIARYGKARPDKILSLSVRVVKKLLPLAAVPMVVIVVAGPPLFALVFGKEWREAGEFARQLSILIVFRFASTPIMHCLNVLEKQGVQLAINAGRVILVVAVFAICFRFGFGVRSTVWIFSVTISATYLGVVVIVFLILRAMGRGKV